jgi:hypothetical protein
MKDKVSKMSPAVVEMLFESVDWIRESMEAYVWESGEISDYDDVDAHGEMAWEWFSQDPEYHLERMAKATKLANDALVDKALARMFGDPVSEIDNLISVIKPDTNN